MHHRAKDKVLLPLILLFLIACGTRTHIVESWQAPDMTIEPGHYQKILTVAMLHNEINRRKAEERLTALMPGRAVPSYERFDHLPEQLDEQQLMTMMSDEGFDGILIMRLLRVEEDSTYVPGTTAYSPYYVRQGMVMSSPNYVHGTWPDHYGGFPSFYSHAYPYYSHYHSTPGYFDVDRYFYFETNLYDLEHNRLVWSSMTSTYEQASMERIAGEVADAVYREMLQRGFVSAENSASAR